VPTETGNHTFWIAGDDACEFWLSTDDSVVNKRLVASVESWTPTEEWNRFPDQQSTEISLQAGVPFYFGLFHKEYNGGDHVAVAWTRPRQAADSCETIGSEHLSSSSMDLAEITAGANGLFFRLEVSQVDSDGDGLSDYEKVLLGLDSMISTTAPRLADLEVARRLLASPSTVNVGATTARGYEDGGQPAGFVVFRTGGIGPITVPYTISGSAVAGMDFVPLAGTASFPAGARSVKISVNPVAELETEPAEYVTLALSSGTGFVLGSPHEASVSIDDAPDVLHVARLRTAPDLSSGGSGTARDGNSLGSTVSLSFGGLGREEVSAEIFNSHDGVGEQILSALASGELWVRVNTTGAVGAEIIGQLLATPALQTTPVIALAPPAPTTATDIGEAARFLTQATFGPTESSLAALSGNSYAEWIDAQLALPPSLDQPVFVARRDQLLSWDENDGWQGPRNEIWWQRSLTAPDQLRQWMAFALSQIFVISQFVALDGSHEEVTLYYDMLLERSLGNYRDLLEEVTLSPVMGIYLSMMRNRKPDPLTGHDSDGKYARENMPLMSVGLSETHIDGSLKVDAEGMPMPIYT